MLLMKKYGTDAFRLYMYQSNAMLLNDLLFDDHGIQDALQQIILPLWNSVNFYISYANIDGFNPKTAEVPKTDNQLDKWILAKLYNAQKNITENMDKYQVNHYVEYLRDVVDGLTNWYIRRSRRRFWASGMSQDKLSAYTTIYYVLVNLCKLFAPVAPILAEEIYKTLTGELSVHLTDWPEIPAEFEDNNLIDKVAFAQNVIYLARSIRSKNNVKNRQPLSLLSVSVSDKKQEEYLEEFADIIAEELNVKKVEFTNDVTTLATIKYAPNFAEIRARYPNSTADIIKAIKTNNYKLTNAGAELEINGENQVLDKEIILVTFDAKPGMHVASDNGIVVSLDLTITDELKAEGIARDIVRNIQDARKQIGCDIMDKIAVDISGGYPTSWLNYITKETLSDIREVKKPTTTITVDADEPIVIKIAKL
jgi:isoleucyl-tRNA synthetase